jgi:hypothetical protein
MRRMLLVLGLVVLAGSVVAPQATAQASDITRDGWSFKDWDHLGNYLRGNVQAESWVDLDWPCGTARDIGMNCDIQRIRGHGLVKKVNKVSRVEIGLIRLGRYPAGTLVENERNKNSGSLSQIEQTTAWYSVDSESCATTFRSWTRTSFAVRWSDGRLSKLSLLSDPTTSQVCRQAAAMTPAQRQQLRAQLPS